MTGDQHAVVLVSGGIDSATCLAIAAEEYEQVTPIFFDYGQQTVEVEKQMAREQCHHIANSKPVEKMPQTPVINYHPVFRHFAEGVAEEGKTFGHMNEEDGRSSGYVPMRNLHFLATGSAIADVEGADCVIHGAQEGDQADYPDCRKEFIDAAAGAVNRSIPDDQFINIRAPLLTKSKTEVIHTAVENGVDFVATWSCYRNTDPDNPEPCRDCPACEERIAAFNRAGVYDPHYGGPQ